jgi:hypothetical protein
MQILNSITTAALPFLAEGVKNVIAKNGLNSQAMKVARRALVLELRQNLGFLNASLGDLKRLTAKDHALICAVALKLDIRVASLLFAGVDREIDQIGLLDFDAENLRELMEDSIPKLPARVGKDAVGQIWFSELLGNVVRKTIEMQRLAELCRIEGLKLRKATKWPTRVRNLHAVMQLVLQILEKRSQASAKSGS